MAIYKEVLEKVLNDIQVIAQKHADYLLDVEEYGQMSSAEELFKQCEKLEVPAGTDISSYESHYKNFISFGLKLALKKTIATITSIFNDFTDLYRPRVFRTDQEAVIIYHYIKRDFDEHKLPAHLEHVAKVQKRHLRERRIDITTLSLQKVMSDVEGQYNNYALCSDWFNNLEADEYERHGDSFFVNRVDPAKLKEKLEFWIKGNIKKQQNWYIVWCLLKYTFHMVKDNKDKNSFAARMNLMFPDVEKKCMVESFRKQENQLNHNRPFDEGLADSDPDYHIA